MGSIDAACISGFLCRLCSEMHRTVIHIYGDQGQKYDLAGKINAYLPVTVSPNKNNYAHNRHTKLHSISVFLIICPLFRFSFSSSSICFSIFFFLSASSVFCRFLFRQIKPSDPLPKTICKSCMKRVQQHHELMLKIQRHKNVFNNSATRLNRTTEMESTTAGTTTTTTTTEATTTMTTAVAARQNSTNCDDNIDSIESPVD